MPFEVLVPRQGERARPHCVCVLQRGSTVWQLMGFSGMGWNANCKQEKNGLGLSEYCCGGLQVR